MKEDINLMIIDSEYRITNFGLRVLDLFPPENINRFIVQQNTKN